MRECCAAYALQILRTWDDVSRLGDNEVRQLCAAVSDLLEDPAERARAAARDAYHALAEVWPDRASEISRDVDPKIARLLLSSNVVVERPPTPPPPPPPEPPSGVAEGTRVRVLKHSTNKMFRPRRIDHAHEAVVGHSSVELVSRAEQLEESWCRIPQTRPAAISRHPLFWQSSLIIARVGDFC